MRIFLTLIFLAITISGAIAQEKPQAAANHVQHGHDLFLSTGCYECHGTLGQGSRASGPRLAPDPLPLNIFLQLLRHPRSDMPPYMPAVLSDADAGDIHAYLASISRPTRKVNDIPALNR